MNYQTWDEMQSIARDVLGDDVKKMLLSIHDDNGLTKLERRFNGRWTPYFQIERYAAHNRRAIDLQLKEKVALELLAHISRFFRKVDYANVVTPESVREPVENVVQAMLGKLREKLDPDSEVTPEQLEKARYLAVELQKGYLKPVTPEQVQSDWQETSRICMKLAPHLPKPDCDALLALLPAETGLQSRKKWTTEKLAELEAYRQTHTMPETAEEFGISEQRIRQLLPTKKAAATPFSGLVHRTK